MRHLLAAVAIIAACTALPGVARSATVQPAQRCLAVKLDAVARAVVAHVSCEARAIEKSTAVRAGCHAAADRRLDRAFERIEVTRGGCANIGDGGGIDAEIDLLVDALLAGATTGRCGATKLRVAARRAAGELSCHRIAARRDSIVGAACLEKNAKRFQAAFERAEKRLLCGTTGDATAVAEILDTFVANVLRHLSGTPPTPSATGTPEEMGTPGATTTPITTATPIVSATPVGTVTLPVTPTASLTATPSPSPTATPNGAPKDLAAAINGADVEVTWTAPAAGFGNTHVRILRRLNTAPTDAEDASADVVFFGTAAATTDAVTALLPTSTAVARTYHYAAFGCTAGGVCESVGSRTTLVPTISQVLRVGGYTLHWRHAAADVCSDNLGLGTAATTMTPDWWKSCDANCGTTATARQMNATGVTQATTIGAEFDRLAIPVGRVISSEFCRNFKTAELMDFGPTIELRQDITYFVYDESSRCDASYDLIDAAPAAGTNTAIIGHAGFSPSCPVLSALEWGEAAIFKPGPGGAVLAAQVKAGDWAGF